MHRCHICGQFLGTSYALSAHRAYVHGTGVGYAGTKTDDEIPSFVSSGSSDSYEITAPTSDSSSDCGGGDSGGGGASSDW